MIAFRFTVPTRRRLLSFGALLSIVAIIGTGLSACAPAAPTLDTIGTLRSIDGGTAMTVPALWAGRASDGTEVGGIEPTEVKVLEHHDGVPEVDFTSIDASGAGAQWRAATAQASAVATLLSARDPRDVDLGFTITGPIDGPSAGGILTVGILATLTNTPLIRGVTMTGTISPDGSIGEVGGVPIKIKAASDAGFTTVVVPEGSYLGANPDGTQMTIEEFAASSTVTVVPVRNVMQAFKVLTGTDYVREPATPVTASPSTEEAMHKTTAAMVGHLQEAIASAPVGTDLSTLELAKSSVSTMETAILEHDIARAYGVGSFALLRLARASGGASAQAAIDEDGFENTKDGLLAVIEASRADAQTARDNAISQLPTSLEKVIYLPAAIGWLTFALATYDGVAADLELATTEEALVDAARIIEEERVGVAIMAPDALAVLSAMPSRTPIVDGEARAFLDGYTELLRRAGDATLDYYTTLAGERLGADGRFSDDAVRATLSVLRTGLTSTEAPASLPQSVSVNATAQTYFVMSNGLLSGAQSYGFMIDDADTRTSYNSAVLETAVETGLMTVEAFADRLRTEGYTVGSPLWSSRWGVAVAREFRSTPESANAAWVSLNETWYDAVSLFMLSAMTSPK